MKKTRFFPACLLLQLRVTKRRMLALLAMAVAALMLSAAAAAAGRALFAGRGFTGFTLAVASEDDDARLKPMIDLLAGMEDVRSVARIRKTDAASAAALVQNGEAHAAVVLPAGFLNSVMTGENLSPKLWVDASRPLEMRLLMTLAESATRMLTRAQQGITFTLQSYDALQADGALQPESPSQSQVVRDINLVYANWVLARGGMFRPQAASLAAWLDLGQFYLLGAAVFFAMLCLPVLYGVYAYARQGGWLGRLRGAGCPLWVYAAAQVAAGALAMLLTLLVLAAGLYAAAGQGVTPGPALLPGLVLCAVFLSCFGFLCCNTGNILSAVSLNFLLAAVGLLCFGGLVPKALLPAPLAALAPFSPVGWMHAALAPLFGAPMDGAALLALLAGCCVLFAGCVLLARRRERRPLL